MWHLLRQRLEAIGFQEENLQQLLGVSDTPLLIPQDVPSYLHRCQQANSNLALATCLWLLMVKVVAQQVEDLFGSEVVEGLIQRELLVREGDTLRATVTLYPCLDRLFVFTDQHLDRRYKANHVYELGTDSYVLARVTPRIPGNRSLDLCTGSGVHALLASQHHQQSVGVDLNPRALEFSRLNAEMNGLSQRCTFLEGDLYAPVTGQTFDTITANPPFVPTPDKQMQLHRTGGETGEDISQRLVAGLPSHLLEGGTFSMVLDYPVFKDDPYLARLNRWLRGQDRKQEGETLTTPGWGVTVLLFAADSREEYIKAHIDASDPAHYLRTYEEYLRCYERLNIEEIGFANVFIRRLPPQHPGFSVFRSMPTPRLEISQKIEQWLQALTFVHDPNSQWDVCRPKIASDLEAIWLTHKKDRGRFEFHDNVWSKPLSCHGLTTVLATKLNGRKSVRQLTESWARQHKVDLEVAASDVRIRLAWMLENLICQI